MKLSKLSGWVVKFLYLNTFTNELEMRNLYKKIKFLLNVYVNQKEFSWIYSNTDNELNKNILQMRITFHKKKNNNFSRQEIQSVKMFYAFDLVFDIIQGNFQSKWQFLDFICFVNFFKCLKINSQWHLKCVVIFNE